MRFTKIAVIILILLLAGGFVVIKKYNLLHSAQSTNLKVQQSSTPTSESPKIISTKPDPLEDTIISATDSIEITFNRPLQNSGEFKLRIEPKTDVKIDLSSDRKTAKIIPVKPFGLGVTYTIFIGPDTKFDVTGNWNQDKMYHFKTVKYTGV